jgi:hypothetical protein
VCTSRVNEQGVEITIACGDSSTCTSGTNSTSQVLGDVTYDQNQNPDNPLTNLRDKR